jgi:DhnA family fructose-bisphosphate aldolase class Ia
MSTQSSADAGQLLLDAAGIVVLCGSEKDMAHANQIVAAARELGLAAVI